MSSRPPTPVGHRPRRAEMEAARFMLAPWRWLTAPRLTGLGHLPTDRPFMLAGNHTLMGVLDSSLLITELWDQCGIVLRPIGDHLHFGVPGWTALLERFGVVEGTRENVRALMRAGESIVVFPGGGREVFKRKGERYCLIWGERTGFARLAIESGYPIVPFAAVGADDVYDILLDANDLLASPLGPVVRRLASRLDVIPPAVRGIGPTVVPRPERFYFHFEPAVETRELAGRANNPETCWNLRERVRVAIEAGITHLLVDREHDPDRALLPRLIGQLRGRGPDGA